jgi:hypothetical protein
MSILGDIAGFFGLGGGGGGSFDINIKEVAPIKIDWIRDVEIEKVKDVEIEKVKDVEIERVKDVEIEKVQHIAPIAAHIKEINNIDPLSVDTFNVSQVRNIDPLRVQQFNVTDLPQVNISLRQLPAVDMNVRRLPPLSLGVHQDFQIPSNYMVRMQWLGFELIRIAVTGQTCVIPRDKFRREQARAHNRSFPELAAAGNPAIPSHRREVSVSSHPVRGGTVGPGSGKRLRETAMRGAARARAGAGGANARVNLQYGRPAMHFSLGSKAARRNAGNSRLSSGG